MNYRTYSDEEFRRLLQTDPDNLELVYEASDRFLKEVVFTEDELDEARRDGYEEGYKVAEKDCGVPE